MKAGLFATAVAVLVGTALAHDGKHAHEARHEALHALRRGNEYIPKIANGTTPGNCSCVTTVITFYGEATLGPPTTTLSSTTYTTVTVYASSSPASPVAPTPAVTTFPTPGTYKIPASTVTLTSPTTVPAATTTSLPSGTQTYGGIVTVVTTLTTVTCPYATVSGSSTGLATTTTVLPSSGTYTIAPTSTYVSQSTVMVYPTPMSYPSGTYTQPETTVTCTETDFVYVCPYTNGGAPHATSTAAPAPASSAAPASAAPAQSSSAPNSSSSGGAGISPNGNQWCMTYSPYTSSGACKDAGSVSTDIAAIKAKGFTSVRIYSTDCNGLENVGNAAKANGLKIVLGVFISNTGISGAEPQVEAICSWAQWDLVELIVIGNEAVFNGYCSAGDLSGFISSAKGKFKGAGYSGPCTTTEPLDIWQSQGSALCGSIDCVGGNVHAFFNPSVSADQAGSFIAGQLGLLGQVCPGKTAYNLETGWPHAGQANGAAIPGPAEQATAIKAIQESAGGKCAFFSFEDDAWKHPGNFGVEQSWGCADQFSG